MKALNIILVIFGMSYLTGAVAGLVTDHLDNVKRQEQRIAYDAKMNELSVKLCAEGKGSAIMYAGKWCK